MSDREINAIPVLTERSTIVAGGAPTRQFVVYLDALRRALFSVGGASTWDELTGKPTEFPPEAHSHAISNVTALQAALDGKAATAHGHVISDVAGLQAALDAVPAWKAAQFSNTDTTTNINVASWADAPLAGATDVANAAFAISGAGVAPVAAGLYRVTASLHFTSVGQRAAPQARFFVDGVAAGPIASTGYMRAVSGHNEASLHLCALLDLGAGAEVTVRTQRESTITTATTFAAAGTSTLMIEGFS